MIHKKYRFFLQFELEKINKKGGWSIKRCCYKEKITLLFLLPEGFFSVV